MGGGQWGLVNGGWSINGSLGVHWCLRMFSLWGGDHRFNAKQKQGATSNKRKKGDRSRVVLHHVYSCCIFRFSVQERVQRLGPFENVPPRHVSAQEGVLAMAPSHSLAVVVHACENYTTAVRQHKPQIAAKH